MSGRIRSIKPEWLEDELIASASDEARVLSIALILMSDDYGNGRASIASIAAGAWRYEMERDGGEHASETLAKASRALRELVDAGFVVLYEVTRQRYFSIRNWTKHQKVDKPGKPRVPPPPNPEPLDIPEIATLSRGSRETLDTDQGSGIRDQDHDHRATRVREVVDVRSTDTPRWARQASGADALTTACLVAFDRGYAEVSRNHRKLGVLTRFADDGVADHVAAAIEFDPANPSAVFERAGRELARRVAKSAGTDRRIAHPWSVFLRAPLGTFLDGDEDTAPSANPRIAQIEAAMAETEARRETLEPGPERDQLRRRYFELQADLRAARGDS